MGMPGRAVISGDALAVAHDGTHTRSVVIRSGGAARQQWNSRVRRRIRVIDQQECFGEQPTRQRARGVCIEIEPKIHWGYRSTRSGRCATGAIENNVSAGLRKSFPSYEGCHRRVKRALQAARWEGLAE